ncbi:MAG: hypothetical protein EA352_07870 [Gemmatimonadales bacterium]|nr:MAG: hypothetical protein EA352_07870 [Gemmatimonadales bacterium]
MRKPLRSLTGPVRGSLLLVLALLLLGGAMGCLRDAPSATDPELAAEFGLPASTPVRSVHLLDRARGLRPLPSELQVESGGLVVFRATGNLAVAVRLDAQDPDGVLARWLVERGGVASPPLTRPGARFVVHLDEAPPGILIIHLDGHRPGQSGRLEVLAP